jgi:hypothetical protein
MTEKVRRAFPNFTGTEGNGLRVIPMSSSNEFLFTDMPKSNRRLPKAGKPNALFAKLARRLTTIASEKALGLKNGEFMKVFNQSREQSRQVVIESSPVGEAIVRLMEATPLIWKGTVSQLLKALEQHTDEEIYAKEHGLGEWSVKVAGRSFMRVDNTLSLREDGGKEP